MTTELKKDEVTRATDRRYSSLSEFMTGESIPGEVQEKVADIRKATKLVSTLTGIRLRAGLTQEQMGEKLGLSQSAISKLESGRDEDLTIGTIETYAKAMNERIGVLVGRPMNHVEGVKAHAFAMKAHLLALAKLAHQDEELEREIQAFFGEAFFNVLTILSRCQEQMPHADAVEVRVQLMSDAPPIKQRKLSGSGEVTLV